MQHKILNSFPERLDFLPAVYYLLISHILFENDFKIYFYLFKFWLLLKLITKKTIWIN